LLNFTCCDLVNTFFWWVPFIKNLAGMLLEPTMILTIHRAMM